MSDVIQYILPVLASGIFSIITILVSKKINQRETDQKLALEAKLTEATVAEKIASVYDILLQDLQERIQDLYAQVKTSQEDIEALRKKVDRLRKNIEKGNRNIIQLLNGIRILIYQLRSLNIDPAFEPADDASYLIESNGDQNGH